MFYRQRLVTSSIYWKTCRVNKQGGEKKSKASGFFPHLLGSWMFMSKFKSTINYRHLERAIIICHSWWQDDISCLDVSALPFASSRAQAVMVTMSDKLRRWVGHSGCVSVCRGGDVAAQVCVSAFHRRRANRYFHYEQLLVWIKGERSTEESKHWRWSTLCTLHTASIADSPPHPESH